MRRNPEENIEQHSNQQRSDHVTEQYVPQPGQQLPQGHRQHQQRQGGPPQQPPAQQGQPSQQQSSSQLGGQQGQPQQSGQFHQQRAQPQQQPSQYGQQSQQRQQSPYQQSPQSQMPPEQLGQHGQRGSDPPSETMSGYGQPVGMGPQMGAQSSQMRHQSGPVSQQQGSMGQQSSSMGQHSGMAGQSMQRQGRKAQALKALDINDFVQSDVVTVEQDTSISAIAAQMEREDVGCVVVVDGRKPVGIVTDRAIALTLKRTDKITEMTADDIMPEEFVTGTTDMTVMDALEHMNEAAIRRLPIVDDDRELKGIITMDDILVLLESEFQKISNIVQSQSTRL